MQLGSGHVSPEGTSISRWEWWNTVLELAGCEAIPTQTSVREQDGICIAPKKYPLPIIWEAQGF